MLIIKEAPRDIEKEYRDLLTKLKDTTNLEIEIDEVFLYRIRAGIANGDIDFAQVKVVHTDGTKCNVTKSGRLDRWPVGMFDRFDTYLDQLLTLDQENQTR